MNKMIRRAALAVVVFLPMMANAETNIAIIDAKAAILNTAVSQKYFKELQDRDDFKSNVKQLETLSKAYNENIAKLKKDSAIMSDEQKKSESQVLQNSQDDIQHVSKKINDAQQGLAQQLLRSMSNPFKQVVAKIVADQKINLLLERSTVLHADGMNDITDKVTAELNVIIEAQQPAKK